MRKIFEIFLLFILLTSAIVYSGCFLDKDRIIQGETLSFYDDSGISSSIKNHFGENMGQIVSVENHTAMTAEAIVSLTKPNPDIAKIWLTKTDGTWKIEKVVKQYVME